MTDEDRAVQVVHGRVKWFDPGKGFGFIVADEGGADILLHANVLRNYGQNSVADGAVVTVKVQMTQRGVQAVEVIEIEPPQGVSFPLGDESAPHDPDEIAALPLEAPPPPFDVATFASPSALKAFVAAGHLSSLAGKVVAAIGPTTRDAASAAGVSVQVVPETPSVPALIAALAAHRGAIAGPAPVAP